LLTLKEEFQAHGLTGKVIREDEINLRVCLVEYNSLNFTQAKKKNKLTTTLVAWAVALDAYIEGEFNRDVCTAFDPCNISDTDIHEYVEVPSKIRSTEILGKDCSFLTNIDRNELTRNGKFVKYITVVDLCRALDCFSIIEIKRILLHDFNMNLNLTTFLSSRDKMCLYQFVLESK